MITSRRYRSDRPRGGRFAPTPAALALALLVAVAASAPTSAAAAGRDAPTTVRAYGLGSNLNATVDSQGTLVIRGAGRELLRAAVDGGDGSARHRRGTPVFPFTRVAAEGDADGQRGFSAGADDDGDGLIDEDPLDGQDNDGDGRVDEDFAAVSDAMVVIHRGNPLDAGRDIHLEFYHWAFPRLRSMVFLTYAGPQFAADGPVLTMAADAPWLRCEVRHRRHDRTGKHVTESTMAWISAPRTPDAPWLGAVWLNVPGESEPQADGDLLRVQPLPAQAALAVCAADSWLQLSRQLNEAARVQEGVTDAVTGRRVPWVPPPPCTTCRVSDVAEYRWQRDVDGDLVVSARIDPASPCPPDPDLFRVGGRALGAPTAIRWTPYVADKAGRTESVAWVPMNTDLALKPHGHLSDPYGAFDDLVEHRSRGRIAWVFSGETVPGDPGDSIEGVSMDGRPFSAALAGTAPPLGTMVKNAGGAQKQQDGTFSPDRSRSLNLAPDLLSGWPNPFNEVIQIRFRVPTTLGETFDWDKADEHPDAAVLASPMPWSSGQPRASVKIYNLNGQELVSLESSSLGPGDYTVQWDGTDSFGRKVASGKYFCKLQLDDWSVTRRLTFLR